MIMICIYATNDKCSIYQRSFPLSEEEYLLRLDDVANTLKCWGAVAHVRNTLEKLKERPRIGKAVSIFIDMDQTGGAPTSGSTSSASLVATLWSN
jgi:hypothetical protein